MISHDRVIGPSRHLKSNAFDLRWPDHPMARSPDHFLAVLCDAAKIAMHSFASESRSASSSSLTIPDSIRHSIQKTVSSASSTTIPIFEINSAFDLARPHRPIIRPDRGSLAQKLFAQDLSLRNSGQVLEQPDNPKRKSLSPIPQLLLLAKILFHKKISRRRRVMR